MKYVILGGGGVFGNWLAKHLLDNEKAERVIAIGRNPRADEPYSLGVGDGDQRYSYEQIHVTFEQDRLIELFDAEKPDVVVNFAALAYATSWNKSSKYYATNVMALVEMCEQLKKRDYLNRFIQIGTSELYGPVWRPANELSALNPTSPYAVSKLCADLHLKTLFDGEAFRMNIIRPSNCYAPGQLLYRIIPRAVWCALTGNKLPLQGGGQARKSFMHADDLARAIVLVVENGQIGETYNVGPENPVTIRTLAAKVSQYAGVPYDNLVEVKPARANEDGQYWLNSDKIKEIGWLPKIELNKGIDDMVVWGRRYLNQLKAPQEFVLRA